MEGRRYDIALAGGGLSGGLIALALHRLRPDLSVILVERNEVLGGSHGWTWFASDITREESGLLAGFRHDFWNQGVDVRFPAFRRRLATPYARLSAEDFDAGLRRELPEGAIRVRAEIARLDARSITLASGEGIASRAVIDCRGFAPSPHLAGGWRRFMVRRLRTSMPHWLARPIAIDAMVAQPDALNFVRVVPLGLDGLLVEDVCYGTEPVLDRRAHSGRLDAYCRERGWEGDILGGEAGMLPIVTGGDFAGFLQEHAVEGVAMAGARAGLFHPLTGSSLAFAVRTALAVAAEADLTGEQLAALLRARALDHWRAMRHHRRLAAGLLGGAPLHRLERLYSQPRALIERLHAGRSGLADRLRLRFSGLLAPRAAKRHKQRR